MSSRLKVAKILFILTSSSDQTRVENIGFQLDYFLKRSQLQSQRDFKIIERPSDDCPLGTSIAPEMATDFLQNEIRRCLKDGGESWDDQPTSHDTIILGWILPLYSRYIGAQTVVINGGCESTLAHELGHRYGNLKDEYLYREWRNAASYGEKNPYPPCCIDYNEQQNPYYKSSTRSPSMPSINCSNVNGVQGADPIKGRCASSCYSSEYGFNANDCQDTQKCCVKWTDVGNNCYPLNVNPDDMRSSTREYLCGGMPLSRSGTAQEDGGKPDLGALYRSIMMGAGEFLRNSCPDIKIIYPEISSGLPWPLKAGEPRL